MREARLKFAPLDPEYLLKTHVLACTVVVAVMGSTRYWKGRGRNGFGTAFHAAANDQRAHVAHDGFESSVCTVSSADLQNFINGVVIRYNGNS